MSNVSAAAAAAMTPPNSQQQQQPSPPPAQLAADIDTTNTNNNLFPSHLMGSGPESQLQYHYPTSATSSGGGVDHLPGSDSKAVRSGGSNSSSPPSSMVPQHLQMATTTTAAGVPPQQQQQQHHVPPHHPNLVGGGVGPGMPTQLQPQQQQQQQIQTNMIVSDPSSLPWTVGSTDGSLATMIIMQQSQQQQQVNGATGATASTSGATIGVLGEATGLSGGGTTAATTTTTNTTNHVDNTTTATSATTSTMMTTTMYSSNPTNNHSNVSNRIHNHDHMTSLAAIQAGRSLYHDRLFHQPPSSVESVLTSSCDVMGFDIAEMWLRTGPKTHQLTNSHLRPTALEDSVRKDLVEVYYGEKSNERTHRLSPALCKRAKDANDVVWVTAHTPHGAEALRMSISNVRTAVAVPVCHEASNTNITIIYFSIRRIIMRPAAVEFLVHMSLCAAVASVNSLSTDGLIDRLGVGGSKGHDTGNSAGSRQTGSSISQSDHLGARPPGRSAPVIRHHRVDHTSITGARLDLQWRQLSNVEYLTDGGNSWIHTAVFHGKPVVVKTLKPECQDVAVAINEIEGELAIHSRLNHPNIVALVGAGLTSKGVRFIVLERLDGGTLTQRLGYDTRIRDRRRRFWRKKQLAFLDVLRCSRAIASAMQYCHEQAIPKSMVLHRDLKPDNICFSLDGTVKLIDFGLARVLENAVPTSNEVYDMSGETGSLRYMSPECAEGLRYNHKTDVYSFGIILWELNAGKKPFIGLNREMFYERVVHGGERPPMNKKWPSELCKLITDCWSDDIATRPTFGEVVERIDDLLSHEQEGGKNKGTLRRLSGIIDRHSTWF